MNTFAIALLLTSALSVTAEAQHLQSRREGTRGLAAATWTPPASGARTFVPEGNPADETVAYTSALACSEFSIPCCKGEASCGGTWTYYACDLETQTNMCVPAGSSLSVDEIPDAHSLFRRYACGRCSEWVLAAPETPAAPDEPADDLAGFNVDNIFLGGRN